RGVSMSNATWRRWFALRSHPLASTGRSPRSRLRPRHSPLVLECLEYRTVPSVVIGNNGGNGYTGLDFNQSGGYVPPDPCGAAGPTNSVETVNQTLAIYSPKDTGASHVSDSFSHFWYTVGGLNKTDSGSFLSDPIVTFDEHLGTGGRFI